jgi:hypothetical protein
MKEFFWKLAGADAYILQQSGKSSRYSFAVIGFSYCVVYIITFLSFFGFFWGVFHYFLIALLGAAIFSFLIGNIYRVVLISLEPQTLPVKPERGSIIFAYIIRVGTVLLFAFFVSKCFETMLFGHWVDKLIEGDLARKYGVSKFDTSEMFVEHMKVLNQKHPAMWLITIFMALIFMYPVFLRHVLKGKQEYYDIKKDIDIKLVLHEYEKFKLIRDKIYISLYEMYQDSSKYFKTHVKVYVDEPFKTKKVSKKGASKSMDEFLNIKDWE